MIDSTPSMTLHDWDDFLELANDVFDGKDRLSSRDRELIVAAEAACRLAGLDIPKAGPCAGCEYHEINRPDGAAGAAGECVEQEAI